MSATQYEILIIGSGAGGKVMAWMMASAGKRTTVVERRLIGGACPNIACLPSKNIIHSAEVAHLARHAAEYGVRTGPISVDMTGVRARKRQMVDGLVNMHLDKYKASGAELLMGEARFIAPKTVEVHTNDGAVRVLTGEQVFINIGTHAEIPDVPGLRAAKPLTHIEALELDHLPEHLIVLGGGFVGIEFAQAMRRFGSRVTMIVRGPQLTRSEDPDVAQALLDLFHDEGIDVLLDTDLLEVAGVSGDRMRLRVENSQGESVLEGSHLLIATGRVPNTQTLGLDKTGVELDGQGYIKVNDRLETTAPGIWALGECAGSPQFTHVSENDCQIVYANLTGGNRTTKGRIVPFCLFTDPELARVGLNEVEARKQGIAYRLAKVPMQSVLRARALGETRGFMKALISTDNDEILGFTSFGPHAGEVMAVVQTAMLGKLPYTALRDAIMTHPTMAEGLTGLFAAVPARSRTGVAR